MRCLDVDLCDELQVEELCLPFEELMALVLRLWGEWPGVKARSRDQHVAEPVGCRPLSVQKSLSSEGGGTYRLWLQIRATGSGRGLCCGSREAIALPLRRMTLTTQPETL